MLRHDLLPAFCKLGARLVNRYTLRDIIDLTDDSPGFFVVGLFVNISSVASTPWISLSTVSSFSSSRVVSSEILVVSRHKSSQGFAREPVSLKDLRKVCAKSKAHVILVMPLLIEFRCST